MTKEKLITNIRSYLCYCDDATRDGISEICDEFFSQNVVIPKGSNRHPYADVLHEWVEGNVSLQVAEKYGEFYECINIDLHDWTLRYRIKQEPVYEWQYKTTFGGISVATEHVTDEEFNNSVMQHDYWSKDESTKRLRERK